MPSFPSKALSPNDFFDEFLSQGLADLELPGDEPARLGVCLRGAGGGEWTVQLGFDSCVASGLDSERACTWVQSVDDWRGALWEGRGGAGGEWARRIFDPAAVSVAAASASDEATGKARSTLDRLARADGLFELCITGAPGGEWAAALQLGAGAVAATPDARVTLSDDDATALTTGALKPLEAVLKGRVKVDGDSSLLLKLPGLAKAARRA